MSGSTGGATGDFLSLELVNAGYLTRFGPFDATLGARWAEATGDTDVFFRLHVEPLAVPLRQDPAAKGVGSSLPEAVREVQGGGALSAEPDGYSCSFLPWAFNERVSVR